jgi:RNA polymerase sigma factor (sigma-70 family)
MAAAVTLTFVAESENDIVRRFAPLITKIATRFAGQGIDVEDLEQEGRIALVAKLRAGWKPIPSSVALAVSEAVSKAIRDARRAKRHLPGLVSLDATYDDDEDCGPALQVGAPATQETELAGLELAAIALRKLKTMPDRQQAIVRGVMAGETFRALAARLKISKSTAEESYAAAMRTLRREVERAA